MDYEKVKDVMLKKVGCVEMPNFIINDDAFLRDVISNVQVSSRSFVNIVASHSLRAEINRYRRIRYGRYIFNEKCPNIAKNQDSLADKIKRLFINFKICSCREKIFFLFFMFFRFIIFKYIMLKSNNFKSEASSTWK